MVTARNGKLASAVSYWWQEGLLCLDIFARFLLHGLFLFSSHQEMLGELLVALYNPDRSGSVSSHTRISKA